MSYLGTLVILGLLILIHEAGHLAAAKLVGIPVAGFSVGFGPKIWSRRRGLTEYALRAFPLGGYVLPAVTDLFEFRAFALASGSSTSWAGLSPTSRRRCPSLRC